MVGNFRPGPRTDRTCACVFAVFFERPHATVGLRVACPTVQAVHLFVPCMPRVATDLDVRQRPLAQFGRVVAVVGICAQARALDFGLHEQRLVITLRAAGLVGGVARGGFFSLLLSELGLVALLVQPVRGASTVEMAGVFVVVLVAVIGLGLVAGGLGRLLVLPVLCLEQFTQCAGLGGAVVLDAAIAVLVFLQAIVLRFVNNTAALVPELKLLAFGGLFPVNGVVGVLIGVLQQLLAGHLPLNAAVQRTAVAQVVAQLAGHIDLPFLGGERGKERGGFGVDSRKIGGHEGSPQLGCPAVSRAVHFGTGARRTHG